ncbi:hypothetical protein AC578_10161 [Pseudocercospora eumusae]|uniref:Uncharacterized protein n=1 Tax=Pseudocercospora eumusae TaxID=321146 RepID=A0A139HYN9_9PEZI|nr:hypothetical protein AC578_10161 [Pseudocercospora eumusae]
MDGATASFSESSIVNTKMFSRRLTRSETCPSWLARHYVLIVPFRLLDLDDDTLYQVCRAYANMIASQAIFQATDQSLRHISMVANFGRDTDANASTARSGGPRCLMSTRAGHLTTDPLARRLVSTDQRAQQTNDCDTSQALASSFETVRVPLRGVKSLSLTGHMSVDFVGQVIGAMLNLGELSTKPFYLDDERGSMPMLQQYHKLKSLEIAYTVALGYSFPRCVEPVFSNCRRLQHLLVGNETRKISVHRA